jgi:rod shape-determining protein MreC
LREENKLLREQLGLKGEIELSSDLVLANVLGNPLDGSGTSLVLDKGDDNGVSVNDAVIKGKYLIGRISRVLDKRSVVELTTSPNLTASVVDVNTKTEAVIVGQYGTSIQMHRILPNEVVSEGDIIVTSGKDGSFLPGFVVGEVDWVSKESASSLKSATIKTLVDPGSIDKVFVVLSQ